ncbi:HDIG domain-containing protein [Synechococcus sp. RSCCF101]|uniref:HDIG domain-containing metalloprotein n=1 Tax=Synechococcus sp. RSCCF101 TaxID=2511069 RepID=UPI001243FABA|nr:HDIG domain-containing metalloprotein [Synechococcus sp. RSCCF101]QEY33270.1 HDIG domain-containing protein [Synechococcus sp. RSCCF101]
MWRQQRPGRLGRVWRRLQEPRGPILRWSAGGRLLVLAACLLVALLSSWPWLFEPSLRPGMAAPFERRAPADAVVEDRTLLDQRRSQLIPRTYVEVVDEEASHELRLALERQLVRLQTWASAGEERVEPISLNDAERAWLTARDDAQRRSWDMALRRALERMLRQGVVPSLAELQLRQAADLQLSDLGEAGAPPRSLGARLLSQTLSGQTNLRTDPDLSSRLIEKLLTKEGIPTIEVQRGDLIIRKGETISPQAYDVLDHFGMVSRGPSPRDWAGRFAEGLAVSAVMVLLMRRDRPSLEARQALLALGVLVTVQVLKLWAGVGAGPAVSPLALLVPPTLLISQGLGATAGLAWLAAAALLWPTPVDGIGEAQLLVGAGVAALSAVLAGRQRSRAQLLQLALLLPLGALLFQVLLLRSGLFSAYFREVGADGGELAGEAALMGVLVMVGLLLAPLIETFFGLLTRARLLELADQERPLLRRLSKEAPGTFEHTLMICGLAEEGARTIGADVDLIRTGALYHDVGKLHAPQWFIENQVDGPNPHDQLDDPRGSARILQAHVDEGLKLARRHRLPRSVADFIPEHQGTLKMGYFFHQARQRDAATPEADFRYRGPAPRSRETGILMLADGCEAALRSLPPETSDQQARDTVRRIVEARLRDGQLAHSGLSRAEVELLIRAFVRVWRRMRHRRIPYPIPARRGYPA